MIEHQCGILSDVSSVPSPIENSTTGTGTLGYLQPVGLSGLDLSLGISPAMANISLDRIVPDLETEDWYSKLKEDELFNGPEGPAPRLCGLRRLARQFIKSERSHVNALIVVPKQVIRTIEHHNGDGVLMGVQEVISSQHFPMASVTFYIELNDGRTFSDSADAYYSNCNDLGLFPTAVASARAEARTLRKVLGIRQHAAEEISDKDAGEELAPDDNGQIKPEQIKLIERMLGQQEGTSLKEVLQNVTTREIFNVEELTISEARKALRTLNDLKKKKKSKKEKQE